MMIVWEFLSSRSEKPGIKVIAIIENRKITCHKNEKSKLVNKLYPSWFKELRNGETYPFAFKQSTTLDQLKIRIFKQPSGVSDIIDQKQIISMC